MITRIIEAENKMSCLARFDQVDGKTSSFEGAIDVRVGGGKVGIPISEDLPSHRHQWLAG